MVAASLWLPNERLCRRRREVPALDQNQTDQFYVDIDVEQVSGWRNIIMIYLECSVRMLIVHVGQEYQRQTITTAAGRSGVNG